MNADAESCRNSFAEESTFFENKNNLQRTGQISTAADNDKASAVETGASSNSCSAVGRQDDVKKAQAMSMIQ